MTSLIIPSNVTSIDDGEFDDKSGAFSNCSSLASLTIPEGVTHIGTIAFSGCTSLTMITFPKSVKTIGSNVFGVFNKCTNLKGLNILDLSKWCGVHVPLGFGSPLNGLSLYVNGEEVHDLIIPDDVTYMQQCVFFGCKSLTSVTIPSSVNGFNYSVFDGCTELTSMIVERAEPLVFDGDNFKDFFTERTNATLYVPEGSVEAYAAAEFWKDFKEIVEKKDAKRTINVATAGTLSDFISEDEKYQIEELTLTGELNGDDIYLIRDMAGINMDKMSDYHYLGKNCITDGKLRVLDLSGVKIVEGGNEYYKEKIGSVSFTNKTYTQNNEISAYMFSYCHTLEELILPSSATVISPFIFSANASDKPQMNMKVIKVADGNTNYDSRDNCNAVIEKATSTFVVGCNGSMIPDGVAIIADEALMDCSGLESVTIPEGVTSIGNSAFSGCSGLTSVAIPNSLETIGDAAFFGCGNLASIVVGSGNTVYDSRDNCNAIIATGTNTLLLGCKNTTIPNGVTTIGGGAFSDCTGLESVTIPESVTTIGRNAFEGCTGLISVTIPNSVTEIAGSAFWKCTGLTSILNISY